MVDGLHLGSTSTLALQCFRGQSGAGRRLGNGGRVWHVWPGMGRGAGRWSVGRWAVATVLGALISTSFGAALAVQAAQFAATARDGRPGDGIGYVVPAFAGAAAGALLVLVIASAVLLTVGSRAECAAVARGVALAPVAAAAPVTLLVFTGSPGAIVVALLPLTITCVAAWSVWRSPQAGVVVLGGFLAAGLGTILVLGLDAVLLLVPHLTISLGSWAVAAVLLARTIRDRRPIHPETF